MSTAKLIISRPGERAYSVGIAGPTVSIGRKDDNLVCLDDTNVSKYHAAIEARNGAYWITDLGSSNGTQVNGEPLVGERKLRDNDLICLGGTSTIRFHQDAAQAARATPPASAGAPSVALSAPSSLSTPRLTPPQVTPPSVPPLQAPSAPALQPPAAAQKLLGVPKAVLAGVVGLLCVVGLLGALWGAGIVGGSRPQSRRTKPEPARGSVGAGEAGESGGEKSAANESAPSSAETREPAHVEEAAPASAGPPGANADASAGLARTLAVQIAQKSSYNFDPGFVTLINSYTNEYRGASGYSERAAKYREAIDREFVNVQGIQPPLIGYVLAMSQTKFVERPSAGVWNLPPQVVSGYANGGAVDMNDPAASTRVAAAYVRSLLDLFEKENFMYAIACYGMTLDEAGKVSVALEGKDPTGQDRYDFWKMKNAGVVQGPQVERVARFFAAGIVSENPRQFGLREKPLSSLY
jgi:hypothetical protein